jgi:hypothetical protein
MRSDLGRLICWDILKISWNKCMVEDDISFLPPWGSISPPCFAYIPQIDQIDLDSTMENEMQFYNIQYDLDSTSVAL